MCSAEAIALPDASAQLVVCKHFLRLAADVHAVLAEVARIVEPGGRAYFIDFNADGPRVGAALLRLWIRLTAPPFIRDHFGASMARGLPASIVPDRALAAGFASAAVVHAGVSYVVRAVR